MQHQQNKIHDVIISGGGMVGATLAVALAREGMRVAIIERGQMKEQLLEMFDGRVSAIALGSKRLLEAIGVWAHLTPHAQPVFDIRVSDADSHFFLDYHHHEVGSEPFGYIVENRHLRMALAKIIAGYPSITLFEHCTIERFDAEVSHVDVTLNNGDTLQACLLVAADGKESPLRKLAEIRTVQWDYNQTAIVTTIAHTLPHDGLAQERFLPSAPFAVLPMTQQRSSLVWVEPNERVQLYLELDAEEFLQEICERVGDYLGDLTLAGERFSYPLSLSHAREYIAPRFALVGDAAHAMHPIAGQGGNVGFRDVAALTQLVAEKFSLGLDIGSLSILNHYQRWRRFDNVSMLTVTDGLNRLFSNEIIPIKWVRRAGLWGVGQVPPLKRLFMNHAMGLTGDVPVLMRKSA